MRFLAALAVIITHVELLKGAFGLPNSWKHPIIFELGSLGVSFFFVLSGFLITFLLLKESELNGKISVKTFYLKRIYRIWPLFYLVMILGFFVLPHFDELDIRYLETNFSQHYWGQFISYLFILPNFGYAIFDAPVPHIGQAWSIGVEEQFYLLWPLVFLFVRRKLRFFIIGIIVLISLKLSILLLSKQFDLEWIQALKRLAAMSKFENMLIGAIGAYLLFNNKDNFLRVAYHRASQLLSLAAVPIIVYFIPDQFQDGAHIIYSLCFIVLILNVSSNEKSLIKLEFGPTNYLGRISYGLYMYHMMLIPMVIVGLKLFSEQPSDFLIYSLTLTSTIALSSLSYYLVERPFIRLKNQKSLIKSGDSI